MHRNVGQGGFTLVELMVALALGLALTTAMLTVLVYSRSSQQRQEQLGSLQQNVRVAFDYLAGDARGAGHMGCYTGKEMYAGPNTEFRNTISATADSTLDQDYRIGVHGYDYSLTGNAWTLASINPANVTNATSWRSNIATQGISPIPLSTISTNGLTPGSDVLVIRTVAGLPVRLTANVVGLTSTMSIENVPRGTCPGGTASVSGFCPGSYGVVANCIAATAFRVNTFSGPTMNLAASVGAQAFAPANSEVLPLQTIVYYVKRGSNGTSPSLYRRVFDGTVAGGVEQELVEGVETMQIRFGMDMLPASEPDGVIDGTDYVTSEQVTDWNRVVAVRMGLLLRGDQAVESDIALRSNDVVNGVTVTFPSTGTRFDRRVFTTTVAMRNRATTGVAAP